jgi:hypothetical protein
VKLPVQNCTEGQEGTTELYRRPRGNNNMSKISYGVYLASHLTRRTGDQAVTSILITKDLEAVIKIETVKWEKYGAENLRKEDPLEFI